MEYDININAFGQKLYYKKGTDILHREDGPAVEFKCGDKYWYINGTLHRTGGPALEWADYKGWLINGKLHRIDGPAIERTDKKEWWVNGKRLSPEKEEILNKWWNNKNEI